jgi:hypothetical protein
MPLLTVPHVCLVIQISVYSYEEKAISVRPFAFLNIIMKDSQKVRHHGIFQLLFIVQMF